MIDTDLREWLKEVLQSEIAKIDHISQSEQNQCLQLTRVSDQQRFFLKIIQGSQKASRLQAEIQGLSEIDQSSTIATPTRIANQIEKGYLLLEWIERAVPTIDSQRQFGQQIACMHQQQQEQFGYQQDNFIAHLAQENNSSDNWSTFYMEQRIEPQFKILIDQGIIPVSYHSKLNRLYRNIETHCPLEPASLIHGDLWGGNYIIDSQNKAYIFDPAVYYGHREMDLAMSLLFGSFGRPFYEGYQESYPLDPGFMTRASIYQIYPLMIHARLFGGFYTRQCNDVLDRWT